MNATKTKPEASYQACMALTDFMQRLRAYLLFDTTPILRKQLVEQAKIVNAIEWRGVGDVVIEAVASAVARHSFDSSKSMDAMLDKYVVRIGGRIFDTDEARYSFLPLFDRKSPTFIGLRLHPEFYGVKS